jgi:hypothetical protein
MIDVDNEDINKACLSAADKIAGIPKCAEEERNAVSPEDRHLAEKAQLKLLIAVKNETIAMLGLAAASKARQEATAASDQVRKLLELKYKIDLSKQQIRETDGAIIPL